MAPSVDLEPGVVWRAPPEPCAYLPDQQAELAYSLVPGIPAEDWERRLASGWRRFGFLAFRPACSACSACVSLRIDVANFRWTRSLRRVWRRMASIQVEVGPPGVDEARRALHQRWERHQGARRGWRLLDLTEAAYRDQFSFPQPGLVEYRYRAPSGELIGVALTDETPDALSAAYTFYDPEYPGLSLGTGSILYQLDRARRTGRAHLYLGYRIWGCASSEYKARFRPHELLVGRPAPDERPRWRPATEEEMR